MSLAYKVEELLALRDSVSESAVSIEKFADEDVIKGACATFTSCPPFTLTTRDAHRKFSLVSSSSPSLRPALPPPLTSYLGPD